MTYQGRYRPKNPDKYEGDPTTIIYRSGWEKSVCLWLDGNDQVKSWSSEEIVIPYLYEVDKRYHRYFMDFKVTWATNKVSLIEVKPHKETLPPIGNKRTKRYITEGYTFVKNQNKWSAATEYCKDRGWLFEIWTENELRSMGILPKAVPGKLKPLKRMKPYSRKKPKK